jgi:MFS family permease
MEKVVALLCVFGLGMCFSLLGSISVKLMPRLKIDQGKFGSLISAFMFTCLIASLIMGVVVDKLGYKPVAIFGFIVSGLYLYTLTWQNLRSGGYALSGAGLWRDGFEYSGQHAYSGSSIRRRESGGGQQLR